MYIYRLYIIQVRLTRKPVFETFIFRKIAADPVCTKKKLRKSKLKSPCSTYYVCVSRGDRTMTTCVRITSEFTVYTRGSSANHYRFCKNTLMAKVFVAECIYNIYYTVYHGCHYIHASKSPMF